MGTRNVDLCKEVGCVESGWGDCTFGAEWVFGRYCAGWMKSGMIHVPTTRAKRENDGPSISVGARGMDVKTWP